MRRGTAGIATCALDARDGRAPITEADPDDISPDGTVRLRAYLTMADSVWLSAGCQGRFGL